MRTTRTAAIPLVCLLMVAAGCRPASALASPAPPGTPSSGANAAIQPGDALGEMVVVLARDETGEPSIFNHCVPIITDSDPAVIRRTCSVPQMAYIFIGYGEFAGSQQELDAVWNNETWGLTLDGKAVNLPAFGYFDVDWEGNRLRQWKVALENATPGEHQLRYVIGKVDKSREPTDVTWVFTVGGGTSPAAPSATSEAVVYPALSSTIATGQNPYTSDQSHLNFLLFVPANYGQDPQQIWPLILYLHGSGDRGNNLEYLEAGGLPKKLASETDFPALVLSPQGNGQHEFWSQDEMVAALLILLEEVQAHYSIDPAQIYLTGASAGGNGVWEIGLRYPDRFAALAPVMGYYGYPFEVPANICDLKDVPIRAFHGAKDEVVPLEAEEGLVNALKACGGNAQLTVFPDSGHDIANQVYANPDLYSWMLAQTRK